MNPQHFYLIGIDMCDAQEPVTPPLDYRQMYEKMYRDAQQLKAENKTNHVQLDKPPASGIQSTLSERGKTHGDFTANSQLIQQIKHDLRSSIGWMRLSNHQKEALDMIVHKIGRIMCGNPNEPDHWKDIAGYATLVENILTTGKSHPTLKGTQDMK